MNTCVGCGIYISEDRMVCKGCENDYLRGVKMAGEFTTITGVLSDLLGEFDVDTNTIVGRPIVDSTGSNIGKIVSIDVVNDIWTANVLKTAIDDSISTSISFEKKEVK